MSELLKKLFNKFAFVVAFASFLSVMYSAMRAVYHFFPDVNYIVSIAIMFFVGACWVRYFKLHEIEVIKKYVSEQQHEKEKEEYYKNV